MILEQYKPSERDAWNWRVANLTDLDEIVTLAQTQFEREIDQFVTPDPTVYARNLSIGIVNQKFNPAAEQILVARMDSALIAYAWIQRNVYMPYSTDEMAEARFVHINQRLSTRNRITILAQILQHWDTWASVCGIKCLCSSTIRSEQDVFLRLHTQAGYTVRGSIAFKRLV
jgi:hypothetical protein